MSSNPNWLDNIHFKKNKLEFESVLQQPASLAECFKSTKKWKRN